MKKQNFTQKEMRFINLCASDLNYRQIAEQMFISPKTVENYREKLFDRLDVKTRVGLVITALKNKLIQIPEKD